MASCADKAEAAAVDDLIARIALICVPAISFFSFVSTTLADVASVILAGISLYLVFQKRDTSTPVAIAAAWMLYLVFVAVYATALNLPGSHLRGIGKYSFIAIGLLAAITLSFILDRLHLKKNVLVVLFLAGLISGGAFVLVRNGALDFLTYEWADSMSSLGKLNRNYVGLICSLSVISISGLMYFFCSQPDIRWRWKIVIAAALALLLLCDVTLLARSQSRTSYFATAAALAVWAVTLLVSHHRDNQKTDMVRNWIIPLLIVATITGLLIIYFPLIRSRFDLGLVSQLSLDHLSLNSVIAKATSSNSDVERLKIISVAVNLIDQRPWLGWGPDATRLIDVFSPYPSIRNLIQFHNGYVQTLVSFGIVGTTLLTVLIAIGIKFAMAERTASPQSTRLSKILFATLLALLVYILVANIGESIVMVKAPAMVCLFIIALACLRPAAAGEPPIPSANVPH